MTAFGCQFPPCLYFSPIWSNLDCGVTRSPNLFGQFRNRHIESGNIIRNLVFYADGTWNDADIASKLTNVHLLSILAPSMSGDGVPQLVKYQEGVGASGNIISRLLEGGIGTTLDDKIKEAYSWLADNYRLGDRIFLFGFSRGAYTVRSLVGLINEAKLINLSQSDMNPSQKIRMVDACFSIYRNRKVKTEVLEGATFHAQPDIHFLGVWDTVGALGIPDEINIIRRLFRGEKYDFYHTQLSSNVKCARHALALDEKRRTFVPTLWTKVPKDWDVKQIWFSGVHSNVGGGYPIRDLSDITLSWMIDEASEAGLRITNAPELNPDPLGKLEDSRSGFFGALKSRPRNVPNFTDPANESDISPSAMERRQFPSSGFSMYWPTINLSAGDNFTLEISSEDWWVPTSLYLESGARYSFKSRGIWKDAKKPHGPNGATKETIQLGHRIGNFWEKIEVAATGKKGEPSTFSPARRFPNSPWFALVGIIANGVGENEENKSADDHQDFTIGELRELNITRGGFLYCCANDAWKFYFNNTGSVTLTVTRIR